MSMAKPGKLVDDDANHGANLDRDRLHRPFLVLDAFHRTVAGDGEGAGAIPETFWYFSLAGGAMLLAYAIYRMDPVFILGQAAGPRDLCAQHLFHLAWQAGAKSGRDCVTG
jgi:lipid A biosynthesis-like protein